MNNKPVKVGIVGCGNISTAYLRGAEAFNILDIVAVADLEIERARAQAAEWKVPRVLETEALLADPEIEVVLNLTVPQAHGPVALAALQAGKSVYNEKPLATTREEGQELLQTAKEKRLLVGSAPDTFYGAPFQTARKLLEDGWIGRPVGAFACFASIGPEGWHPSPHFFYKIGAGPLFDMGPYYLTGLVNLLGPIRRVAATAQICRPQRRIGSQPHYGEMIDVETPTHVSGALDFECGVAATLVSSWEIYGTDLPRIEIYGTEGALSVPDPNCFDGPLKIKRAGYESWQEVPAHGTYTAPGRAVGLADLAWSLRTGHPHRASGELAFHVLDIMHSLLESSAAGRHLEPASRCAQPRPLPAGPIEDALQQA